MNKELLLKDICTRLLYHTIVSTGEEDLELVKVDILNEKVYLFSESILEFDAFEIKPYFRPMSSMTEEEKEELSHLLPKDWSVEIDKLNNFYFDMSSSIFMEIDVFLNIIDWLNAHHFDYRGLIEKGLALEAPEGMYETEKQKN